MSDTSRLPVSHVHRILWFGSIGLIGLGVILTLVAFGCAIGDAINGWGKPVANAIVGIVFAIVFGIICVPQYFSVFRRSRRSAIIVMRICVVGIVTAVAAAIIYPIIEYRNDHSPPGIEILGAVSLSGLALLFVANRWLHKRWLKDIEGQDGN